MMKKRSYRYLGLALLFALVVFLIERPGFFGRDQDRLLIPGFDVKKIGKIEFEHLIGGIQLKRVGEGWKVAKLVSELEKQVAAEEGKLEAQNDNDIEWFDADATRVHQALGVFGDLTQGVLVSSNPEKQIDYHVGATGQKLKFYDLEGKLFVSLLLGKNGPDFVSNYVRREGSNDVYLVDRSLQGLFSTSADDFKLSAPAASEEKKTSDTSTQK